MAQACTKACIKCSTAIYPLLTCPLYGICSSCTPKNCSDNTTKYKFSECQEGYAGYGIGGCPTPVTTNCQVLGYTKQSCPTGYTAIKCPFGSSVYCFKNTK